MKLLLSALVLFGTASAQASTYLDLKCDYVVAIGESITRHALTVETNDETVQVLSYKSQDVRVVVAQYDGDEGYVDLSIIAHGKAVSAGTFAGKHGNIPRLSIGTMASGLKDRAYVDCRLQR